MTKPISEHEKTQLDCLFCVPVELTEEGFDVPYAECETPFTAATLFHACAILGISPEQLFWNPDLDWSGVYYDGEQPEQLLVFEVRR